MLASVNPLLIPISPFPLPSPPPLSPTHQKRVHVLHLILSLPLFTSDTPLLLWILCLHWWHDWLCPRPTLFLSPSFLLLPVFPPISLFCSREHAVPFRCFPPPERAALVFRLLYSSPVAFCRLETRMDARLGGILLALSLLFSQPNARLHTWRGSKVEGDGGMRVDGIVMRMRVCIIYSEDGHQQASRQGTGVLWRVDSTPGTIYPLVTFSNQDSFR